MLACQILSALLFAQIAAPPAATADILKPYREAAIKKWEGDIRKFEKLDAESTDPDHAILFMGSSSIRRWDTIAADMAPWPTIKRGYGGAKFTDLAVFVDRIVTPHEFDAVCVFVANDITGGADDRTPAEVLELYKYCVERIRKHAGDKPVCFIEITPTSSRWDVWEKINAGNTLIREYCESSPSLHFIATSEKYLNESGVPNDALFVKDKLHLNSAGYKLWATQIKAVLKRAVRK